MKIEEWQQIGEQAKIVEKELIKLMRLSRGRLNKKITARIGSALNSVGNFKNEAEENMFLNNPNANLDVFYGDDYE